MRVIVGGGGPGGSNAARTLAEAGIEMTMIERELTRPKPCGGAIPPLVVEEFGVPESLIDHTMTTTNVFSPPGQIAAVPVVGTKPTTRDGVGMVRREVFTELCRDPDVQRLTFDSYMRKEMARMPWSTQFRLPVSVAISVLRNKLHNRGTWPKSLSSADVLIREGMVAGGAD